MQAITTIQYIIFGGGVHSNIQRRPPVRPKNPIGSVIARIRALITACDLLKLFLDFD